MNCFVVIAPNNSDIGSSIKQAFPQQHAVVPDRVWIVAGPQRTCSEVSQVLSVGEGNPGVVTKLGEYYGYFDRALWQDIEQWRQAE